MRPAAWRSPLPVISADRDRWGIRRHGDDLRRNQCEGAVRGRRHCPGIEISLEALGRRSAELRKVDMRRPRSVIAKNAVEALQSGMFFGVAAQVDGMVAGMIVEPGVETGDVHVISTGHLAPLVRE